MIPAPLMNELRAILGPHWLQPGSNDTPAALRELCFRYRKLEKELADLRASLVSPSVAVSA